MRVFVTGATGYIGGSVAAGLLRAGHHVSGLVRAKEQCEPLKRMGIDPVLGSLEDPDRLALAARECDGVIHAASADQQGVVEVFVDALRKSGKFFVHTTGSGIVNDQSDGEYAAIVPIAEDTWFDVIPFRQARVKIVRLVREAGIDQGIRTIVICPSMIYGKGRGLHAESDQIPKLIAASREAGAGVYYGKGLSRYSNVHIDDLVDLFVLAIERAPSSSFFFAENGVASFREIAELIARTQGLRGKTTSLGIDALVAKLGEIGRFGVAANSFVKAQNARRLGWKPKGESLAAWFESTASGR